MQIRRTLAIAALSAVAVTGFAGTAAHADSHLGSVDCTNVDATIAEKKADFKTARDAYTSPLGQLIKAERAEARAEARQSREALKALGKEIRHAENRKEAREAAKAKRQESRDLAAATEKLDSRKVLRQDAKAAKRYAKEHWDAVKADLRELRAIKDACELAETETETETDGTETETGTDVITEPVVTEPTTEVVPAV